MNRVDDRLPPPADRATVAEGARSLVLDGIRDSQPGRLMTAGDISCLAGATADALNSKIVGEPLAWSNPATGAHGTVAAYARRQGEGGSLCRMFDQIVVAGRQTRRACGTAYLAPQGVWAVERRGAASATR